MRTALYPGTFDPVTNGHIDIIKRASTIFDRLIVTVAINSSKSTLFSIEERIELTRLSIAEKVPSATSVEVERIDGLLVDFARSVGAVAIVRGLRTLGDFEYEMQMALMNRRLYNEINTFFIAADERYVHLNSTIVREIARYGADVSGLVPKVVVDALQEKYSESSRTTDSN